MNTLCANSMALLILLAHVSCASSELGEAAATHEEQQAFSSGPDLNVGHQIIELEAALFGASDASKKLDDLLSEVAEEFEVTGIASISDEEVRAGRAFQAIAQVLRRSGFRHAGTYPSTLTTVLVSTPRHFDCDTGSFIYLSVADHLGLPVEMVEVEVEGEPSQRGFGDHNFVRWTLSDGRTVDWDPNAEHLRSGDRMTDLYGFAWSRDQLMGYVHFLRGIAWRENNELEAAISDYERSIALFPESPKARNNLAWLLATAEDLDIPNRFDRALTLAKEAVGMHATPNYRDTLACAYALSGRFDEAIGIQEALVADERADVFVRRLEKLRERRNCIGEI